MSDHLRQTNPDATLATTLYRPLSMPIGRFFRKSQDDVPDDYGASNEEDAGEESYEDVAPEFDAGADALEASWRERAAAVLPGGSSTGSKRPEALYGSPVSKEGEQVSAAPTHFVRASGCHITTPSESVLIDCTMALGAVALGYADEEVCRAAANALFTGHVSGLPHVLEVDIAERLCDMIPCADQVRFLKTGAEAVAAAVRIARTATGRSTVVASGYFGWHDWCSSGAGIPAAATRDVHLVPFNDIPALRQAIDAAGNDLAAVLLEPVVERLPDEEWIRTASEMCEKAGAVLIFDELKTGFRLANAGYQEMSGITPHLATFGKAMGNGFPIAAVVGQAAVMEAATRTWISSTAAAESSSLAAVGAVLNRYAEDDVCAVLAATGKRMREAVRDAVVASGVPGVSVEGLDPMWFLRFEDAAIESAFLRAAVAGGVLFKRGAYNYASMAHNDESILMEVEQVASGAFVEVMEQLNA